MALTSSSSSAKDQASGRTEFEILKASHKFLRGDDDKNLSWDEQLAQKYYDSLYREFAVCDLKHYKSGNFALRWRTEAEVLSGVGENTCGNTRCGHHLTVREDEEGVPRLTTLEVPFAYVEQGEKKSALVKIVLCESCCKKMMWKRRREKERVGETAAADSEQEPPVRSRGEKNGSGHGRRERVQRGRARNTRSLSPRQTQAPYVQPAPQTVGPDKRLG